MDVIEIDRLRLRCMIGFSAHELKDKQDVVIDLRIGTDMRSAALSDDPDDAFNYRTLTKAIIAHGVTRTCWRCRRCINRRPTASPISRTS